MYVISKDFTFSAAHWLNLSAGHPCSRVHGHNYTVRVLLEASSLDDNSMVLDYHELRPFGDWLTATLDHGTLNDHIENPTAENLARHLHDRLSERIPSEFYCAIGVSETPTCWAWYRP